LSQSSVGAFVSVGEGVGSAETVGTADGLEDAVGLIEDGLCVGISDGLVETEGEPEGADVVDGCVESEGGAEGAELGDPHAASWLTIDTLLHGMYLSALLVSLMPPTQQRQFTTGVISSRQSTMMYL
jgi:hypothetical protein